MIFTNMRPSTLLKFSPSCYQVRCLTTDECGTMVARRGLVLGVYDGCKPGEYRLSATAAKFDEESHGKLMNIVKQAGLKLGTARTINNLNPAFYAIAAVGVGMEGIGYNECENINECKENIRVAAAAGARALQDTGCNEIAVEGFTCAEAAAEGAALGVFKFEKYRSKDTRTTESKVELYDDPDKDGWDRGIFKAESQNLARCLEDMPANRLTPSVLAEKAIECLCPCGVHVDVRDRDWMEVKKMNAFLNFAKSSSCEPPLLMEISYCGGNAEDKPIALVGKGVTFDAGGLCLRSSLAMGEYRADMAGAAVIIGTLKALAVLGIPINVNAVVPLCENMPGGMAMKPGDVLFGMSGKSIRLQNTRLEGRVILSDALTFALTYKPCLVMNVATLSEGIRNALGESCSGVYSTSEVVWREMSRAGSETGDRVWRMPLWKYFTNRVTHHACCDMNNVGGGRGGDPCSAAAFLLEFVPGVDFVHLDITGTGMLSSGGHDPPYLRKGVMTGRPTRTLIQFLNQMACPQDKPAVC